MKSRDIFLSVGGFVSVLAAAYTLADPIPFPESRTYTNDFENDPEAAGWIFDGWLWEFIPDGVEEVITVRDSDPDGLNDLSTFNPDGEFLTLLPKVPPQNYRDFEFSGDNWIVNAAGIADEEGVITGIAQLDFTDVPEHGSLSIDLKLGVGGSIDGDDGPFEVRVDGVPVFSYGFGSGGGGFTGSGVTQLVTGANLTGLYQEQWDNRGGQGPRSEADRSVVNWTLDSAYDLSGFSPLTDIPHTSDELSIQFIHHLSSGAADEHVAIDDLVISLSEVAPPPPNKWPGGDTFVDNFSPISKAWTLSSWANAPVSEGVKMMTGSGNGNGGLVRRGPNNDAFGEEAFEEEGVPVFPIEPIIEGQSFTDIDPRFEGDWLQSTGSGTHNGTATLFLEDLPPHDGLELSWVLAATDSFDGDDVIPDLDESGNFQVLVDGESILVANAKSDVTGLVEELVSGANLTNNYRESWLQIDEGPESADDRETVGWTLDNAYDWSTIFAADGENPIAHSAETLTISLVHGLNSSFDDEGIAIDSFELKLLNVSDPVTFSITNLAVNSETNAVSFTWNSMSNKTYGVDRSFDLLAWDELADGVVSGGTETTYEDARIPAETREAYYRVRQE